MILVGGPKGRQYRVFDTNTQQVSYVRHVRFDETVFPGFHLTEKKDGALADEKAQEYLLYEDK
jgi:hypothetical protein